MAQTNLTIRIDEELKHEAEVLFGKIGLNMSAVINAFFRQAVGTQAMPFEFKSTGDYFTGKNLAALAHSAAQAERGLTISFTMAELESMEEGEVPERATEFLLKHKGELLHG